MARRELGAIGDVSPIEYGGGVVFGGEPGVGGPWVEYTHGLDNDVDTVAKMTVYRADLHSDGKEFLSWTDWVDWDEIAEFAGQDPDVYSAGQLRTAQQRANAVFDAASYYGWEDFDGYPLQMSAPELAERWGIDPEPYIDELEEEED